MDNILYDSRLHDLSTYQEEFDWWCHFNRLNKDNEDILEFAQDCLKNDLKAAKLSLKRKAPRILVIETRNKHTSYRYIEEGLLSQILDKGDNDDIVIYYDKYDIRAKLYKENKVTDVLYRFTKNEDTFEYKRLLTKIERQEQYSNSDLSRASSSLRPLFKEIYDL